MGTNDEDSAILENYLERLREREKKVLEEMKSNPDYWKQNKMQKGLNLTPKELRVVCNYYSNIYAGVKIEKKRPNNTLATGMSKVSLG